MKFRIEADNGDSIEIQHTHGELFVRVDNQHGPSAHSYVPASAGEALAYAILAAVHAEREADQ